MILNKKERRGDSSVSGAQSRKKSRRGPQARGKGNISSGRTEGGDGDLFVRRGAQSSGVPRFVRRGAQISTNLHQGGLKQPVFTFTKIQIYENTELLFAPHVEQSPSLDLSDDQPRLSPRTSWTVDKGPRSLGGQARQAIRRVGHTDNSHHRR